MEKEKKLTGMIDFKIKVQKQKIMVNKNYLAEAKKPTDIIISRPLKVRLQKWIKIVNISLKLFE